MLIAFSKQCLLIPIFVGTAIPIEEVSKIGIFLYQQVELCHY
jgi:hypothetical protein